MRRGGPAAGGAFPEERVPPRPAREGVQSLHRARRQRQCQRQQRHHRRDSQPPRGGRQDHGLSDLCRLPAGGFHGQDAGRRAQPLERVWKPARARALADRDALQALVAEEGGNFALAPWDWRYYAEKLRQRRANFDDAAIKPYLVLDHMIEAAFDCATRLFGVPFSGRKDIPAWHPDVRVWEVKDSEGRHKGLFYGDYFARPSK